MAQRTAAPSILRRVLPRHSKSNGSPAPNGFQSFGFLSSILSNSFPKHAKQLASNQKPRPAAFYPKNPTNKGFPQLTDTPLPSFPSLKPKGSPNVKPEKARSHQLGFPACRCLEPSKVAIVSMQTIGKMINFRFGKIQRPLSTQVSDSVHL